MIRRQSPPIDRLLIHTAELQKKKKKKNAAGGWVTDWVKEKDLKCRFTVYSPKDVKSSEEQRQSFPNSYMVVTRADELIVEGDRFLFNATTYEVMGRPVDPSFLGHHLEMEVRIVTKEG